MNSVLHDVYFDMPMLETITDLARGAETLRRRRYGVIEAADGHLRRVTLRPFPKIVSIFEPLLIGRWRHRRVAGDRVRLYYNQPRRCSNFLTLTYMESTRGTRFGTVARAMAVLDEIARLKGSDALLCDVTNRRISEKLLSRWGWAPHCPARLHRNFIKRFYENYPSLPEHLLDQELGIDQHCQQ